MRQPYKFLIMKNILFLIFIFCTLILQAQKKEINDALSRYDYKQAINLINKEKANSDLDILKAKCYKNLLNYHAAIQLLEKIIQNDSLNIQVLTELADNYQLIGNYKKAEAIYTRCMRLQPESQFFKLNYISVLYKLKEWDQTIIEIKKTLTTDTLTSLYALAGDCYWQIDDNDSAVYYYKKTLQKYPQDYNTTYKLAKIYLQLQKYTEIIDCTENYIALDSTNKAINQFNGIGYCFNQQYEKAIYQLCKIYKSGDKTFTTNYFLGASYFGLKDYYPAYEHLSEAYQKDSSNLNLIYYLGRSAILSGKFSTGTTVLKRGLDLMTPKDSVLYNYYNNLALGYSRWNKPQEAIKNYETCLKLKPESKLTVYTMASIYDHNLKNPKQALKYYTLFLSFFPKEPENNNEEFQNEMSGTYYSAVKNRVEELKTDAFFQKK